MLLSTFWMMSSVNTSEIAGHSQVQSKTEVVEKVEPVLICQQDELQVTR